MKIMTILGSPRKEGNTGRVLGWVHEALQQAGHTVDAVHIIEYKVSGCRECYSCQKGGTFFCVQKDDANLLFERMLAADLVVFAAPVFCWGFPAQLKALLDRMLCLVADFVNNPDYITRIQGLPLALLATSGGPVEGNAELMVTAFENMVKFMKTSSAGSLVVPLCSTPDLLKDETRQQAEAFAQGLIAVAKNQPSSS